MCEGGVREEQRGREGAWKESQADCVLSEEPHAGLNSWTLRL